MLDSMDTIMIFGCSSNGGGKVITPPQPMVIGLSGFRGDIMLGFMGP